MRGSVGECGKVWSNEEECGDVAQCGGVSGGVQRVKRTTEECVGLSRSVKE